MRVKIDRDLCTGVGNCVAIAPTAFKLDKTNKAVLLNQGSAEDSILLEAAESCPVNAIILDDDNGNQIYP